MRLNEVCDQKQNTLNEKKVALDQLSKLTDHCIQFVNHALDKGSDMALLYSKKYFVHVFSESGSIFKNIYFNDLINSFLPIIADLL